MKVRESGCASGFCASIELNAITTRGQVGAESSLAGRFSMSTCKISHQLYWDAFVSL